MCMLIFYLLILRVAAIFSAILFLGIDCLVLNLGLFGTNFIKFFLFTLNSWPGSLFQSSGFDSD